MRGVLILLWCFVSVSYTQNFKLCNVSKADSPLITVDQSYLLKTLYGPFIEAHGQSDKRLIPTNIHPFIYAAHKSYAEHRPLSISPDGIWLLISQGAISYLANHSEEYKEYSSSLKGDFKLVLDDLEFSSNGDNEWIKLIDKFNKKLSSRTSSQLEPFYSPSFSTTDLNIRNAFKICQLSSQSEQFQFGLFSLCGIPEITLEGTTEDWLKIAAKLEQLKRIGMFEWADHLKPIIEEFIEASKGNVDKTFWNSFYKFNNECGDASISGWILNFFPYNTKGDLRHFIQAKSSDILEHVPDSDPNMSFPSGRNYLPFVWRQKNNSAKMRFEAGFMGISQDPKTLALKAEINWAVVKRPASGNISVWQQNVVREAAVSKMKLSAAFSATYIDIDGFINEEDSGLENLKLLEYAIVKRPVKGAFLRQLTKLPNFKALELHDWNIDRQHLPYISKLKNSSFIFLKPVNNEFFKYLPNTTKTLIFKNSKIKADYFTSISVAIERIDFQNCTFEDGALRELEKIGSSLRSITIHKSKELSSLTLQQLSSIKNLKSLTITSCKIDSIPEFHLPKLEFLDLSTNKLSSIENIQKLISLRYLNLANNRISDIKDFNHFPKLEQLILHHNEISVLKIDLEHLSILDVSSNKLETLPLIGKNKLVRLIVEKNQIDKATLPSSLHETLEYLALERVHLNRKNAISISSMKKLKFLSLKNCDLTNEDINELGKLNQLSTLKLWTNKNLDDQCKGNLISLFKKGANISIFDCGFSSIAMDEFAKLRESLKVN